MKEYDFTEIDENKHVINEPQTFYAIDDKTAIEHVVNIYSSSNMDKSIVVVVTRLEVNEDDCVEDYEIIARLKGGVENDS